MTIWRKATFSDQEGNCVELARLDHGIGVRDSKNPDGPHLAFNRSEMRAFIEGVKAGEFDDLG